MSTSQGHLILRMDCQRMLALPKHAGSCHGEGLEHRLEVPTLPPHDDAVYHQLVYHHSFTSIVNLLDAVPCHSEYTVEVHAPSDIATRELISKLSYFKNSHPNRNLMLYCKTVINRECLISANCEVFFSTQLLQTQSALLLYTRMRKPYADTIILLHN